ncbi:MAG: hypothetical protein LUD80_02760 [Clostridiales bacterium]|nr:hypothetical protein [Clostridiales bacterium]
MCKALDEQRRERYVRRTLWAILLLSPLIAVWIMGAVTGTSVTRLDAYNTTWNDEIGYLRAVRTMRTQGLPTGVQSYNEVASDIPAYGAYIFLTYLPYAAMSFLTGLTSHNFMYYSNVLPVVLANAVFLRLVKPDIKKTIWLIALSTLSLTYERYVWSGMSEASYCAFLIVALACFLWLLDGREHPRWKENVILVGVTLLILFFGMLWAFHYAWVLIPGYYILVSDRSRRVKTVSFLGGMAAVILCFCCSQYLSAHWAAVFFSDTGKITETLVGYLQMLSSGLWGDSAVPLPGAPDQHQRCKLCDRIREGREICRGRPCHRLCPGAAPSGGDDSRRREKGLADGVAHGIDLCYRRHDL